MRVRKALRYLALCLVGVIGGHLAAQVPGETSDLTWCPGTTCLEWSTEPLAASYNVYRGTCATFPDLLTGDPDSCRVNEFTGTNTGPVIDGMPPLGCLHWFLVTALNGAGEGTSGNATAGARTLDSAGLCASPSAEVVINEVDYDQPGSPDADEFVELYNPSSDPVDLTGISLVLVNGATQIEYSRVDLNSCAASLLLPGNYLVIASPAVVTPPGTDVIQLPAASNSIQNGPDALALFDTGSNTVLDALSYEGLITAATIAGAPGTYDLVEGSPTPADSNTVAGSLNRIPNGVDTDDAANDWSFSGTPTPGASNGPEGLIVINEVDYDQPGSPDADEFVELHNPSPYAVDLTNLILVFVNGANQLEYARVDLNSGATSVLLSGDYLVVASPTVSTPPFTNVIPLPSSSNSIQNGPDAVAIFDTATNTVLDALSYEGTITMATINGAPGTYNLVEGSPASADSNTVTGSLSRIPNGVDTDDAATDWSFTSAVTAGSANLP